jgi:hypothetical protein
VEDSFFNLAALQNPERSLKHAPMNRGATRRAPAATKSDSDKKGLDTAPRPEVIYVLYMSCYSDHSRTLTLPWAWPLRAELDKGGLKVEPAWEINLTENTGLSAYFRCELERRVPVYINSQDEGDSHNFIEN